MMPRWEGHGPNIQEQKETLKALEALAKATRPPKRKIKVDILIDTDNTPAPTPFERMREAYAVMKAAFEECVHALKVAEQRFETLTLPQLGDLLSAMRQTQDFGDGLRKEYAAVIKLIEARICDLHFSSASQETPIKGEFASITPKLNDRYLLPTREKNEEVYRATMAWLNVPEDLIDRGKELYAGDIGELRTEVVKLDFRGFNDLLNKYVRTGYVLPPCIKSLEVAPEPAVIVRKTEDLL